MGFAKISDDTFGIMFQLGKMGTVIIPIDLDDEYYENHYKETSIVKSSKYSPIVKLVNYVIDEDRDRTLYVDNLSSELSEKYGSDNSEDLFYNVSEDPVLFNKMTRELLAKFQKYTH